MPKRKVKSKMEQLPPGFRFYPTEEELITFYLRNKLNGSGPDLDPVIPSVNIYNFEPPQLPGLVGEACEGEREQWFFFILQQEREARGGRLNRTTNCGYWKATGSPTYVYSQNKVIGVKKTMVFYKGKAPIGRKTKWKMNEYKAIKQDDHSLNLGSMTTMSSTSSIPELRHELSLCRVYITSGCPRAFDRRPPARTMTNTNTTDDQTGTINANQRHTSEGTPQDNEATTRGLLLMERSSSTDSSKSGGNDHNTLHDQAGTSNVSFDIEMTQALEPLWDWEQLNWL